MKDFLPALALVGFDPLTAGGDLVPVRHGLSHNVGPAQFDHLMEGCLKNWHLNVAPVGQVQVSGRAPLPPQGLPCTVSSRDHFEVRIST